MCLSRSRRQARAGTRVASSVHLKLEVTFDMMFPDNCEDIQQVGEAQKLANARADVDQLKATVGRFCGDVEADDRPQAHAVHDGEIGEIEDHAFGLWDK